MKKKDAPKPIWQEKEKAQADTIGAVFDYYAERGYKSIPENATIHAKKFRSTHGKQPQ